MKRPTQEGDWGVLLIILYMFLEYVRPQSIIEGLSVLHIPMLVQIAIVISLTSCSSDRLRSKESLTFLALVCLMALHVPFAVNNYWAFQITRNMALQLVVFLGIVGFLRTFQKLERVLTVWIIVATLCGIRGYFEGGRIPDSGFLGDENDFSLFLNMMIPLAFFTAATARSWRARALRYSGVVVFILGTVSSMSRGGFVGMIPPLAYCWWKTKRKFWTAAAAALVGVFLVIVVIPSEYWTEMKTIRQEGTRVGTGQQRAYLWTHGYRMFLDHPLIGVGPGNFNWNLRFYEPPDGLAGRSQAGRPAHSIYFTLLPELGVIGFFLFLRLIWVNQKEFHRLRKTTKHFSNYPGQQDGGRFEQVRKMEAFGYGLTGAIIAYLVSGAFLSTLYYGHFWLIVALSTANNRLLKDYAEQMQKEPLHSEADAYEDSRDRWDYARGPRDYSLPG